MKVTIDEIARFIKEGWPQPEPDWFIDDTGDAWPTYLDEDHAYTPRVPGTIVTLEDFECDLCYQGSPTEEINTDKKSFVKLFKKWKKSLTVTLLAVEIPNEKCEEFRQAVKALGGKLLN